MIKVSDYIFQKLQEHGIDQVFLVTGGGAMHLNDSISKNKNVNYLCCHHEQACAIAAEGYFRVNGKMAVVNVTSGPGGLNTLTGVMGQWTDSIPALYISGQVKYETTIDSCKHLNLRQLGDQEINIIDVVKPITKFAELVKDPLKIRYYLEKAIFLALNGRPGPVWLDIPLDVQAASVDEYSLDQFNLGEIQDCRNENFIKLKIDEILNLLKTAHCPAFYIGQGIRLADAQNDFFDLLDKLKIPVLTAISGHDLIWSDHPLFFGRPGVCGDRLGNIMVQNCDLLFILGTRLGIRQISYNYKDFAPNAIKIMVDIDETELAKPTLDIHLKINADIKEFLKIFNEKLKNASVARYTKWINWGRETEKLLPTIFEDNPVNNKYVNSYSFADVLFKKLDPDSIVVTGNGTAYTSTFQIMKIKKGMRVIANHGCAAMGYDLPAAIGACLANSRREIVLLTGDGSIMMNLQELQTIASNHLSIKIFILDNYGYLAIRTTQTSFFDKRFIGESSESGISFPDFKKISNAFRIKYFNVQQQSNVKTKIHQVLEYDGPVICRLNMDPCQTLYPKVASSKDKDGKIISRPLEDMFPFLPENILKQCYYKSKM